MKSLGFIIAIAILISSCSKDEMNTEPGKIQTIVSTIKIGDSGAAVINLQNSLKKLVELGIFKTYSPPNSPTTEELQQLLSQLRQEIENQYFGEATRQLTRIFQIQQGLGDSLNGVVENTTADKLNQILKTLGLIS